MLEVKRIEQNIKPNKLEHLGNNIYYYNYDIKEYEAEVQKENSEETTTETRWSFIQVRISGKPDYGKCVKALIRTYLDENEELDLINSHNSYQLDVVSSDSEYQSYLELIKSIKEGVKKDFSKPKQEVISSKPKLADIIKLMLMAINTMSLTDEQALSVKSLYPEWATFIGLNIEVGIKILYSGKLFKVVQKHLVQEHMPPSIHTASLYTEIVEDHSGTINDPIPYPADGNMVIYKDKYYTEDNIIYKCIRDSENPLYAALKSLVGIYVELV